MDVVLSAIIGSGFDETAHSRSLLLRTPKGALLHNYFMATK